MNDDFNPYAPPAAKLEQENPDGLATPPPEAEEDGKRFFHYLIDLGVCGFVLLPSLFLIRKLFL